MSLKKLTKKDFNGATFHKLFDQKPSIIYLITLNNEIRIGAYHQHPLDSKTNNLIDHNSGFFSFGSSEFFNQPNEGGAIQYI